MITREGIVASFRSATWKVGTKDTKVYIELWNDDQRIIDAELSPDQAHLLGQALIDNAARQGYQPE